MKPLSILLIAALAAGCQTTERPQRPVTELFAARDSENGVRSADFNVLMNGFIGRARDKVTAGKGADGTPPTIDLLVVSGGGDWGAFGAGVL